VAMVMNRFNICANTPSCRMDYSERSRPGRADTH
jgi:hypothetical protein